MLELAAEVQPGPEIDRGVSKRFEAARKLHVEVRNQLGKFIDTLSKVHKVLI